ncbi:MAG: type I-E CRISPR-associated protein Cse1/CasA [Methylocystis sp.]
MALFSLLHRSWLPVRRRSGARSVIRPAEIASAFRDDPIVAFAWGRPDFDSASREFMIGLLATAFPPPAEDDKAFRALWNEPPDADRLDEAFAPFAEAFLLDGDGPRFMQDFDPLDSAEEIPASSLLIDAPGANALKENKDLFQKRGLIEQLSRGSAAMALFALQTFAPSGGAGHRTSLRGGGPLTTLVVQRDENTPLWRTLWLNTPEENGAFAAAADEKDRVFPWLAPTFASDGKPTRFVAPSDRRAPYTGHVLQAFWGMPRRVRLTFSPNEQRTACPIAGAVDDTVVASFRTRPWGVAYDPAFIHPLSPYYRPKGKGDWLPVHPQPGGLPYSDWPAIAGVGDEESRPAAIVSVAIDRLTSSGLSEAGDRLEGRLIASGYDMDNMKARGFVEAEMPIFLLPRLSKERRDAFYATVKAFVGAADLAASVTGVCARIALAGERAAGAATPFAALRERFFLDTQDAFFNQLRELTAAPEIRSARNEAWLEILRKKSLALFEEAVSFEDMPQKIMERAVPARRNLLGAFRGYGATGKKLFAQLGLAPSQPAEKIGKKSRKNQ